MIVFKKIIFHVILRQHLLLSISIGGNLFVRIDVKQLAELRKHDVGDHEMQISKLQWLRV